MQLRVMGKDYDPIYVEKAILFYEHLENHKEVKEALKYAGIPMCKICGKSGDEIWKNGRNI